jgi:hypothetical protein
MGQYLMGPSEYYDAPVRKAQRFMRRVRLTAGYTERRMILVGRSG